MMRPYTNLLFVCCLLFTGLTNAQERKLLFIGIDGVRSDALNQANTPNIDEILDNGIYTYDSWHMGVTSSGPSWSSMLTGVWEAKHGIFNNSYSGANFWDFPYFPNYLKQVNPDLKCVQIITWNPMDDAALGTGGNVVNAMWDLSIDAGNLGQGLVTAAAKIQLLDPELDVLFIHYDETDAAGHGFGFSPSVPQYMNAIEGVDSEIGEVLEALKNRINYDNEDWVIVSTTDHGGSGTSHGGNSDDERHIWWYASGNSLPNMEITGPDPGSFLMPNNPVDSAILENTPVLTDIAVTAIDWMLPGVDPETYPGWRLDGKSWIPDDIGTSTSIIKKPKSVISVFPNPAKDILHINSMENYENATIQIIDFMGRNVFTREMDILTGSQYAINISSIDAGTYSLRILSSEGHVVENHKVVVLR